MRRLGTRVIDDQHANRLVMRGAGEDLDLLQQAAGVQGTGEELQTAGADGGQASRRVGFGVAEEQHGQLRFQTELHLFG